MIRTPARTAATIAAACVLCSAAALAAELQPTPAQPKGPFYPRTLPAESDADLALYQGKTAQGEPVSIIGRVLTRDGSPVAGASVEIWQTNRHGRYHHEADDSPAPLDPGFQGWGRTVTGPDGAYRFRTIRPQAYGGRTPHIHFAVTASGRRPFVTQMYFADARENERDFIFRNLSETQRARLVVAVQPQPGGDPVARFDIVLP